MAVGSASPSAEEPPKLTKSAQRKAARLARKQGKKDKKEGNVKGKNVKKKRRKYENKNNRCKTNSLQRWKKVWKFVQPVWYIMMIKVNIVSL